MYNVRIEDRISAEELVIRLNLKNWRGCVQDRRLQWFNYLKRMEESTWSSKCRTFNVSGSFSRGRPRKTWNEVIRSDLKENKVSSDLSNNRNA